MRTVQEAVGMEPLAMQSTETSLRINCGHGMVVGLEDPGSIEDDEHLWSPPYNFFDRVPLVKTMIWT